MHLWRHFLQQYRLSLQNVFQNEYEFMNYSKWIRINELMCLTNESFALMIKCFNQINFGCFHAWEERAHDCLCSTQCVLGVSTESVTAHRKSSVWTLHAALLKHQNKPVVSKPNHHHWKWPDHFQSLWRYFRVSQWISFTAQEVFLKMCSRKTSLVDTIVETITGNSLIHSQG